MSDNYIRDTLATLNIPEASANAARHIVRQAETRPRHGWQWWRQLRLLRAWMYVPTTRYVIMTSAVAIAIMVGLFGKPDTPVPTAVSTSDHMIGGIHMLEDIDFGENQLFDDFDYYESG